MTQMPSYFEAVRREAVEVWKTLQDPVIAGPWHQLFQQVQSPRHVLSELLQNADDAGASAAQVRIEGNAFVFEHNGEDFREDHFRSLCRFGYSNKRALHTIGFRGLGFKSTFSLGDTVELYTPTLAVRFHASRWTEPHAVSGRGETNGATRVRVEFKDHLRKQEIEHNLQDWLRSPVSLLFFKNIRNLTIGDEEIRWKRGGDGPVTNSRWMSLQGAADQKLLLISSEEEPFPDDALQEIRLQRMVSASEETMFPPCRVEIVLGAEGRLYVVLPTGVQTDLPFAINAPFIQDPARLKIKEPEISPTNRWLLGRIGNLAASSMLRWLQADLSNPERAKAYDLLPDSGEEDNSLEAVCAESVRTAFRKTIEGTRFLLTEAGKLNHAQQCICLPDAIRDVWDPASAARFFDPKQRSLLSKDVSAPNAENLCEWQFVEVIDISQVIDVLREQHLPKPESWRALLRLWSFLQPHLATFFYAYDACNIAIVPVQGRKDLQKAKEVVRIGEKKLLQSHEDWEFLSRYFLVLNQNWPRFLAEQKRTAQENRDDSLMLQVEAAYKVLGQIELAETSIVNDLISRASSRLWASEKFALGDCVRLTQIAAALGAQVDEDFRYYTRDGESKSCSNTILFDVDGSLEDMLPVNMHARVLLHPDYSRKFQSCTKPEWLDWVNSESSRLRTFAPIVPGHTSLSGKHKIEIEAKRRGLRSQLSYPYTPQIFIVEDWDFASAVWDHWKQLARNDNAIWVRVLDGILDQREGFWNKTKLARLLQQATTGSRRSLTNEPLPAAWIMAFRNLPCVPDTHGRPRKPSEVLRRTPATEPLRDIESFIDARWDTEVKKQLLDWLGVSGEPTGPDKILEYLRSLASSSNPPAHEVEKWYRRLDQMLDNCSSQDARRIREVFHAEKLILVHDGTWANSTSVFQALSDDDVPDAPVIRPGVADLSLWRKIGVPERPTLELMLAWLEELPVSEQLSPSDRKRVLGMTGRFPLQIWDLGHWPNIAGEWVAVEDLLYSLAMHSLISYQHLHPAVTKRVADFRQLSAEQSARYPFARLRSLASSLEERLSASAMYAAKQDPPDWISTLARNLGRVEMGSDEHTAEIRGAAARLAGSTFANVPGLEVVPFLEGTPAGTPRKADVAWVGTVLCIDQLTPARLAKAIPQELGRIFRHPEIRAALDYCVGRASPDIDAYFAENFRLSEYPPLEEPDSIREETDSSRPPAPPAPVDVDTAAAVFHEEDCGTQTNGQSPSKPPRQRPQPPPLIELFALGRGFRKHPDGSYRHEDGQRLLRLRDDVFEWGLHSPDGSLKKKYWVKSICLEEEPVQIAAEAWTMLERDAETVCLIMTTHDGRPQELPASVILDWRERGIVALHPATYRLVKSPARADESDGS
jgi:hypothetical protein